jgi:hypothetical protein
LEVRKSALLANALQFIESEIEDLEKGERIAKRKTDTAAKLDELVTKYSNFKTIDLNLEEMDPEQLEVIFNLLTKADDKALQLMNTNIEIFEALRKADLDKKGIKWEDLILRFEWLSNWTNI